MELLIWVKIWLQFFWGGFEGTSREMWNYIKSVKSVKIPDSGDPEGKQRKDSGDGEQGVHSH